ncbi:LIM domain-containing protein WLIM1-like [Prunus yedoensis var. nudiflora]|uniref:LIM domain-containing protein WLIM1-like n=1 Tax=Prunus yedoensis var. nudiflora TaxID=2094558 RepID=A0A314YVD8_PRUYE|nr:LIM domain-containing protein WLIM1-like [Prunus yedoensis var. nudiflora]
MEESCHHDRVRWKKCNHGGAKIRLRTEASKPARQWVDDVLAFDAWSIKLAIIKLSNYNSFEGVLYCRPHFDQLFKRTGSLDKSFEGTPKIVKPERPVDNEKPAVAKASSMFGGTRDKCFGCKNTVYPTEKVTVNGTPYHKMCFKCSHGGCTISPSNYIAHEGRLYCKHHHTQLIKEKGNLSQLEGDYEKSTTMRMPVPEKLLPRYDTKNG